MSVAITSGIPSQFTAGDTIIFTVSNPDYPPGTWTYDFVLSRDGQRLAITRATNDIDGLSFDVTLTAAITSPLAPGMTKWTELFTEIATGQRVSGCSGYLLVAPDPNQNLVKSQCQKMLDAANEAILKLSASPNVSVSFNGQSFTKRNFKDLLDARDRLQVVVFDELRRLGVSNRGGAQVIVNRFR